MTNSPCKPGVRERLVFHGHKYYSTEAFLRVFSSSTLFLWPFEVSDAYTEDESTRSLQFSPEIMRRFNNINYWAIDESFLCAYPEFRGDMPSYNSIPGVVQEKAGGGQEFCFHDDHDDDDDGKGHGSIVRGSARRGWDYGGAAELVGGEVDGSVMFRHRLP